jgi:C-terminal processing protease CtpA/Prc
MNKSYKRLSVVLAVAAFALGYILRQTSNTDNVYRIWASAKTQDTRQMAAYNSQGAASDVGTQSNVDLRPMETYYSVLRIVQDSFVERVNDDTKNKMTYDSVRTMLDSLKDPYTRFYEPDQTKVLEAAQQGKYYGIGAIFAIEKEKIDGMPTEILSVMTVIPGSPADKVGLRTGDVIEEVDGKSVLPYDPFQKANQILKSARDNTADREKLQKELDAEDKRIKNGISFQKSIDTLSAKSWDV